MRKLLTQLLICAIVFNVLVFTTACPKGNQDKIRKAAEASYQIGGMTNDVVSQVQTAFDKGLIDAPTKRKFGEALNILAKSEVVFIAMVKTAHEYFVKTGKYPNMAAIQVFFDAEIIAPFIKVLELFKVLTGTQAAIITAALAALRLILSTVGSGLNSKASANLPNIVTPGDVSGVFKRAGKAALVYG